MLQFQEKTKIYHSVRTCLHQKKSQKLIFSADSLFQAFAAQFKCNAY